MRLLIIIFLLAHGTQVSAQGYLKQIKVADLCVLWRNDSINIEGNSEKTVFPEPLGFIGNNYQRFYIHYTSVTKSKVNPLVYLVKGKTQVKNNICSFHGTVTIKEAKLFPYTGERLVDEPEPHHFKQGSITSEVIFYEDSSQNNSGYIKGNLITDFYIDKENNIKYDALMFVADGFRNNQCKAMWTSYKTGLRKKCNWGDFRIPDAQDLDVGAGLFSVDDKYLRNGWETYMNSWIGDPDSPKTQKAVRVEQTHWWE